MTKRSRFYIVVCSVVFFGAAFAFHSAMYAQQQIRQVVGSVRDQHGAPIKQAVVQLENEDTHGVESYATDADGSFHFKRVLGDVDYEVSAAFNGMTSKKVSISKFDDKQMKFVKLTIELH